MAVAELDVVAGWVAQATVVAHRIRLFPRGPDQAARILCFLGDPVHFRVAVDGEAEVTVVIAGQVTRRAAWHDDEDEAVLLARLGHPDDPRALAFALVDDAHAAEVFVERDTGVQVGNVQGQVSQVRSHGMPPSVPGRIGQAV